MHISFHSLSFFFWLIPFLFSVFLHQVLVPTCGIFFVACGVLFLDQRSTLGACIESAV